MNALLRASLAATSLLSVVLDPAYAEEPCGALRQIASVPVETLPTGLVDATMVIEHQALKFLLDTRVTQSLISAQAAAALALPREPMNRITRLKFCMDRVTCLQEFATADAMNFGELAAKVRFGVAPGDLSLGVPGLLGADFLRNFDVEFDFAKSRVNLFSPNHCQGGVVYWTRSGASRIPMEVSQWGEIGVDAELDGKSIKAELASGFPKSHLDIAQGETKYGIPDRDWKMISPGGYNSNSWATCQHVFRSLTIGEIQVANVDLAIESGGERPYLGARLFLGMDILRQLHLYIAYKERNLYVSAATATATAAPPPQQPTPSTSPALQQSPSAPTGH